MNRHGLGRLFAASAARTAAAWLTGHSVTMLVCEGDVSCPEYGAENLGFTFLAAAAAFLAFSAPAMLKSLGKLRFEADYASLFGACVLFCCVSAYRFMSIYYSVGCFVLLLAAGAVCFGKGRLKFQIRDPGARASAVVTGGAAALAFAFVTAVCVTRYASYYAPNYDFGIFANMFENMRRTGLPVTTCERDGLLSHFAVHISPIFYLLLPLYCIVPRAETLLVVQAAAIASGVVPVWLFARKKTGSNTAGILFSALYLLYPAFSCGAFFDFHENKFLLPLILWALYFMEEKKRLPMYFFLLLTAMVKEDAAVYTAVIGLYMLFGKKEYVRGSAVFLGSAAYFAGAVALLNSFGEGAQLWRYSNIAEGGFAALIGAVIVNPMRVLSECVGDEKIKFIVQMLFPLLGLPLVSKRPSRYILLIPFLLVNLMPDYIYQHDIGYQYTYGSGAFLIYLSIVNWTDISFFLKDSLKTAAAGAVCAAALLSYAATGARGVIYFELYHSETCIRETIDSALALVPEDASVAASTLFVAHLADREEIYDLDVTVHAADYVAADLRNLTSEEAAAQKRDLEALGYEQICCTPYVVAVYKN